MPTENNIQQFRDARKRLVDGYLFFPIFILIIVNLNLMVFSEFYLRVYVRQFYNHVISPDGQYAN